ncbi:ankyrin repeat domain-containing protein [Endozoicomonas atrinae]|uniref:ankyrin repeat domain-containing protein n=1 Tax=Endozoicomonas atrinae TaxID=1333660 RepID=UPI003AFFEC73
MDTGIGNLQSRPAANNEHENNFHIRATTHNTSRFSPVDVSRWVLSSTYNFMYDQLSVLGRKIARTEPVAGMLMKRYVANNDKSNVIWMIENGMIFDKRHKELAYMASTKGYATILDLLLKNNAPAESLIEAFAQGRPKSMERLLTKYGLALSKEHYPLVVKAATRGDVYLLKVLISKGAPVYSDDHLGETPLTMAVRGGHIDAVKLLVERGAPVNNGLEVLFCPRLLKEAFLANQNSTEIVSYLLKQNPFSPTAAALLYPQKEKMAESTVAYERRAALSKAIELNCNNHIICLLLIELGEVSALDLFDSEEKLKNLCIEGANKNLLKMDLDANNYRHKLESAIIEAHQELELKRFKSLFSLKSLATDALKKAVYESNGKAPLSHEVTSEFINTEVASGDNELIQKMASPSLTPYLGK